MSLPRAVTPPCAPPPREATGTPYQQGRGVLTALAAALVAGVAGSGSLHRGRPQPDPAHLALAAARATLPVSRRLPADRVAAVSRSADRLRAGRRDAVAAKRAGLDQRPGGASVHTVDLAGEDPRTVARALLPRFGFAASEFSCLDALWMRESGWDPHAANPYSGAYGLPQALPGSKMASAGADWADNVVTQVTWGLGYIRDRYGTPCGADGFQASHGWY